MISLATLESPLGPLLAGATDDGLCLLEFAEPDRQERQLLDLERWFGVAPMFAAHRLLDRLKDELAEYFAAERRAFSAPLVYPGTPFQQRVWRALLEIPYGQTCSYAQLAEAVGSPGASRAVGTANGRNRIAIVIPCHRVVNASGALGGYGGGIERKERLLAVEQGRLL